MLERIQEVLRNRKDGDKGFSLVELAVVIVIIGILVAIAVPIFANLQNSANVNTLKAAAANGASMVASEIASESPAPTANLSKLNKDGVTVTLSAPTGATAPTLTNFCVTAAKSGVASQTSGPACP